MSSRPRLLEILHGAYVGGVERYGLTIGLGAASAGWEVHAAFPPTQENAALISAFQQAGVTTHALDQRSSGPSPLQVIRAAARTIRVVRRVRPSVVHVSVPLPTFGLGHLIGCALCRVPTVVVFHSTPSVQFAGGRSRRLYPWLRARARAWVAVSEHVRSAIVDSLGIEPEELTVIRNGVMPARSGPISKDEKAHLHRGLGLPASAFLILSVGRLGPEKGHADIIPAAVRAASQFPRVHFVIAGEGDERGRLESLIRDHQLEATVHLAGQRTDVDQLLRAADLFVFPSYFEGSPFALLEAAAHGLPIISAEFVGSRDVISHRESGLLHAPGDTDSLWRWIEFALQHPREMQAMGARATRVADGFSQDEMVKSTLALLARATSDPL